MTVAGIILDTNVVSEPLRPVGTPKVIAWLDRQAQDTLFLTATSLSELLTGVRILPDGERKERLEASLNDWLPRIFGPRILPFDREAAEEYARIVSRARARGGSISFPDAQIAAIALVREFAVATRDAGPFRAAGVAVIDPWAE